MVPGSERLSPAFRAKVAQVARRLKMDPQHLLTVMSFETAGTFDPAKRNEAGSGATGLIQFMPATARQLGTTTEALARMAPEEQLDYVERYLRPYAGRMRTQQDAYLAVLNPSAMGKPASQVLFREGTPQYALNKALDKEGKGTVTIGDTVASVGRFVGRLVTPASAEASPVRGAGGAAVSPAAGRDLSQELYGTPAAPPAPRGRNLGQDLYGAPPSAPAPAPAPAPSPAPAPGPPAPAAQAPQSLLGRIGQAAELAGRGTLAGQVYNLVQPALQAQYGEHLQAFPRAGTAGAISAGGAMLGTAAGTLAAPFTGPLAPAMPLVGEMAGSYLARQLNVGLGLEEPGWQGDVASVALPPAVRGATRVIAPAVTRIAKAVTRNLPGAATTRHDVMGERLTQAGEGLRPARPVADSFAEAARYNPPIAPNRLHTTASEIVRQEMRLQPSARNPELVRIAEDMRDLSAQGTVPMQDLYAHQQRIGELVRSWRHRGDTGGRDIRRLYAAFHDDLERAAARGVPGAAELRTAIRASRMEHAADEFADLFQPGNRGVTIDPQGRVSLHGGRLRAAWDRKLRQDDLFRESLTPEVRAEMEDIITQAQRLERLRPPRGAQYGSGRGTLRGTVGAGIGGAIAGPPGAMAGTVAALNVPDLMARAMETQRGRAAVRWALQQGGGRINADDLAVIAAVVRPAAQEAVAPPVSETGGGSVGP